MKINWKKNFDNENYFHIYNRGTDKREIFGDQKDYIRLIRSMRELNRVEPVGSMYENEYRENKKSESLLGVGLQPFQLVEFICYCLNPNHFHFLLRQQVEGGITEFMKRIGGGYTNYFKIKYKRSGSLFQGRYKAAGIITPEHLLDMSVYINGNPKIHGIADDLEKYLWCSCQDYLGLRNGTICNKNVVLENYESFNDYKEYLNRTIREIIQYKREQKEWLE